MNSTLKGKAFDHLWICYTIYSYELVVKVITFKAVFFLPKQGNIANSAVKKSENFTADTEEYKMLHRKHFNSGMRQTDSDTWVLNLLGS